MIERHGLHEQYPHWGEGSSAGRNRRLKELELERRVSDYIRDLAFLWIKVDDEPSSESDRKYIERNAIALASNYQKEPIDPRSDSWIGQASPRNEISDSGLWNIDHVAEEHESAFLDRLEAAIEQTTTP
jgi:hypothetical protein